MLRFLSIQRLAVIDAVEIEFQPGFNVLTGETGAGKSILVEAVSLLLGGRASADLVRTGAESAIVQAVFELADGAELIVKREVTAQGRSRAFVNDELVTSAGLKAVVAPLVELHGQSEHQSLLAPVTQLDLLDRAGGWAASLDLVERAHRELADARRALDDLIAAERTRDQRLEFVRFQLNELDKAAPRDQEDLELETERRVLASVDRIQRLSAEAYAALYDDDQAALARLALVWRRLSELADLDPRFSGLLELKTAVDSALGECSHFLRHYIDTLDSSPERLQQVEDRLAVLERLKRRFGGTLADVMASHTALREELDSLEHTGVRRVELQQAVADARQRYVDAARDLSSKRRGFVRTFLTAFDRELAQLALQDTRARFDLVQEADERSWTARGSDRGELLISPNAGEELRALSKIASGGELSRMMLALKTIAADPGAGTTLIFDEVDAGIGGRAADAVGSRLQRLGEGSQVLCITHLPQVACYGSTHYRVDKIERAGRTKTFVTRLDEEARVDELARMIGGTGITPSVVAGARDMLGARRPATSAGASKRRKGRW